MIILVQFPWSPFCLVQRRILEFARVPFQIKNIPSTDRSLVWKWTRQRYYAVPIIKDGRNVIFETDEDSQVIAKYLDVKCSLGLFPPQWAGVQNVIWRHIEHQIEDIGFRLNDIYYEEMVPKAERLLFLRHKERKFGRACIEQWRQEQASLLAELSRRLMVFEQMLAERPFLLAGQPLFVDFNLFGMLANFLYSGHYSIPEVYPRIREWYQCMKRLKRPSA